MTTVDELIANPFGKTTPSVDTKEKIMATGMPTVRKGMNPTNATSEQVIAIKKLQDFLGIKTTPADYGYFGPKTETVVKDFQKRQSLTADGVVGPATWAKIAVEPTPAAKAAATAEAASVAAKKIKEQKQAAKPKAEPAKNPVMATAQTATQVATKTAEAAKTAVTATAKKTAAAVKQTHVVIKKQPLWLQVVTFAVAGLGAIAGFQALSETKRRAA